MALARRRNVFARHSWENDFYLERIGLLSGATILEVFASGTIDDILEDAESALEWLERVALVSSTLGVRRKVTHSLLAISVHKRFGFDLAIAEGFQYLRSSSRREPKARGIPVDDTFISRFNRCGFPALVRAGLRASALSPRLRTAVNWLFESRQEPVPQAAVVKSAIAFESLLILNDHENLRGPLSERAAFFLSDDAAVRRQIAKAVKSFYDVRSAIVHGGRKHLPKVSPHQLEGIDRLLALLMITLASNTQAWPNYEAATMWVDEQRWGVSVAPIKRPFPGSYLTRALQLARGKSGASAA